MKLECDFDFRFSAMRAHSDEVLARSRSSGGTTWLLASRFAHRCAAKSRSWLRVTKVSAAPSLSSPRAVRPTRCTWPSIVVAQSKLTTFFTPVMSSPLDATSVAIRIVLSPALNLLSAARRFACESCKGFVGFG